MQQYLPFTVLKPAKKESEEDIIAKVATVLTVYGIETFGRRSSKAKLGPSL